MRALLLVFRLLEADLRVRCLGAASHHYKTFAPHAAVRVLQLLSIFRHSNNKEKTLPM